MKILVVGYFEQYNLGDEAFKAVIPLVLGTEHTYCFHPISQERSLSDKEFDVVILGPGDVVVDYFFERFKKIIEKYNGPVVLFGGGITYSNSIQKGYLNGFDHVFLRNTTDLIEAQQQLGTKRVHYVPDVVFSLKPPSLYKEISAQSKKKAGVFLISSFAGTKYEEVLVNQLVQCFQFVAKTHRVVFVRFNTSGSKKEDDGEICQKIISTCPGEDFEMDSTVYTETTILERMKDFDVNICARFHSHVFSIVQQIPFVSLCLTRKVHLLMKECGLANSLGLEIPCDPCSLQATEIPVDKFKERFQYAISNVTEIKKSLREIYEKRHSLLHSGVYKILMQNIVQFHNFTRVRSSLIPSSEQTSQNVHHLIEKYHVWEHDLCDSSTCESRKRNIESMENVHQRREIITIACERVCFEITRRVNSKYLWGFVENMISDPSKLGDYITWIYNDYFSENIKPQKEMFWFDYMDQKDFHGSHRSGWKFAIDHLRALNSERGVLMDTCIDRTFHWGSDALEKAGIIPYTQAWVGFLHHTPLEEYSDYNAMKMVKSKLFQQSLLTCKGIYVLSETLKKWLQPFVHPVKVQRVYHPMETVPQTKMFSLGGFKANPDKKLVQIGAWLRNTFAIYRLALHDMSQKRNYIEMSKITTKSNTTLTKCILKGKNMHSYMPPSKIVIENEPSVQNPEQNPCRMSHLESKTTNKWVVGLQNFVNHELLESVRVLDFIAGNDDYDNLLKENIVFLNLYDASACNTLLECVIRETPLLINPLPSVMEVLGPNYPFYYNSYEEALEKSRSFKSIERAHSYLKNLDKKSFDVGHFVEEIVNGEIYKFL